MPTVPSRRPVRGFAVVAVLVIVAMIAAFGITYLRHTALKTPSSASDRHRVEAEEAALSGVQLGQQAHDSGNVVAQQAVGFDEMQATVSVTDGGSGRLVIDSQSLDSNGLGSTLKLQATRIPWAEDGAMNHPNDLPKITADMAATLTTEMGSTIPVHTISGMQTVTDKVLEGIVIVEKSSALLVDNVVVKGAVITRAALSEDPVGDFNKCTVPCLLIDGPFRVESAAWLPDTAIVMPDGVVRTWNNDASVHLDGSVVSHTIELNRGNQMRGTVNGTIAYCDLQLADGMDVPGLGRPREMPDALDPGNAWEPATLATLPRPQTIAELSTITGYWEVDTK